MSGIEDFEEDEQLLPTLTPKEDAFQIISQNSTLGQSPWGRLVSFSSRFPNVDLIDQFSFGRSVRCTETVKISAHKNIESISKEHFKIYQCNQDNLAYIKDLSKNGTFLNEELIGKNKKKILVHGDIIAITSKTNNIYKFFSSNPQLCGSLPKKITNYVLIEQLGHGACGMVYLVKNREDFQYYAIKKIVLTESHPALNACINHPDKIFNEIQILRKLSHPCIVSLMEMIRIDREAYLVLEYMSGGDLTKRIFLREMSVDNAKFFFLQIILATEYLHSHGVLHRDLKPDNILLRDNANETLLKITDFGLSKITEESNYANTVCGTLRFVAPEVIEGSYRKFGQFYGTEVDIWSIGVILYVMIAIDFPFKGDCSDAIRRNILNCQYDISSKIWQDEDKKSVKDLLKDILKKDVERRFTLSQIFQHEWIKNDPWVKNRVRKLLSQEGVDINYDVFEEDPLPKKIKFDNEYIIDSDSSSTLPNSSSSSGSTTFTSFEI